MHAGRRLLPLTFLLTLLLVACETGEATEEVRIAPATPAASPVLASAPAPSPSQVAEPEPARITLGFVGDLMFARRVEGLMHREGPLYPFAHVLPLFDGIDLLVGNLEGTFTDVGTPLDKFYVFSTAPELAVALADAGFFAVSLSNNHATDYGLAGLERTLQALDEHGIRSFGAGMSEAAARAPLVAAGLDRPRVAFLGYSAIGETIFADGERGGVAFASVEAIEADVRAAREHAEIVVVSLHFGIEYDHRPTEQQRTLARAAVDAGAALVVGHHPHVLQPWERHGEGVILYSLGNFVFDLDAEDLAILGPGAFQTAVAVVSFEDGEPVEVEFRPAFIDPFENRPRFPTEAEVEAIEAILVPLDED